MENRPLDQVRRANDRAATLLEQLERLKDWTPLGRFVMVFLVAAIGASAGIVGVWLSWPWLSLLGEVLMGASVVVLFGAVIVGATWDIFTWFKRLFSRR